MQKQPCDSKLYDNVEEQDIEDVKRFAAFIREKKTNK